MPNYAVLVLAFYILNLSSLGRGDGNESRVIRDHCNDIHQIPSGFISMEFATRMAHSGDFYRGNIRGLTSRYCRGNVTGP